MNSRKSLRWLILQQKKHRGKKRNHNIFAIEREEKRFDMDEGCEFDLSTAICVMKGKKNLCHVEMHKGIEG